jgi:hypothetical protein
VAGAGDCTCGVAIGPASAGFCFASSAVVSSIARLIGMRTTPLFLSTQAYVFSAFSASSRTVFSCSMRFFARISS